MTKREFLSRLNEGLSGLPQEDAAGRLAFYSEMIDDRIEDGLSEEEAVAGIGPVEKIVAQIIEETPLTTLAKEKLRPKRRLRVWEIVLLVLGSPLWLSLLLAAFAVVLTVYLAIWVLVLSLWIVDLAFFAAFLGGLIAGVLFFTGSGILSGLPVLGAGLVFAGLSIFLFFLCKETTKCAAVLTKKIGSKIKSSFKGRRTQNETDN
ncbi:MAG: DUF1700 domain-containing protein [Clostridia bacterium]|nr:DUF1700 domain-containing protein [Clostridia bacterium]